MKTGDLNRWMADIQQATLAARERTGKPIGTRVKAGLFQIVLTYAKGGTSTVIEVSEWMPEGQLVAALGKVSA